MPEPVGEEARESEQDTGGEPGGDEKDADLLELEMIGLLEIAREPGESEKQDIAEREERQVVGKKRWIGEQEFPGGVAVLSLLAPDLVNGAVAVHFSAFANMLELSFVYEGAGFRIVAKNNQPDRYPADAEGAEHHKHRLPAQVENESRYQGSADDGSQGHRSQSERCGATTF